MMHRGPDEEGLFVGDGAALGMRRLSIIDLAGGQQPVFNEDRSVCVVFNGEIYNYRELHKQLVRAGHRFRTESDTETIVHLYEDYGTRCVDHLRGMFAFAIWDMRHRRLLLARDRLGIKPLYYAETDAGITFASELKPILALPHVDRAIDWHALSHLFTFMATPASQSIIKGVSKLEPARLATAERGSSLRIERYWDVEFESDCISSEGELIEQLREVLADAVAAHEISDVPVGAFLSGGIDSSAVVATMAARQPGRRIKTFSIVFVEDGYDELVHAREVARAFGTEHHEDNGHRDDQQKERQQPAGPARDPAIRGPV
jgi:asparagine synthase (glutamine-hydrolysing)